MENKHRNCLAARGIKTFNCCKYCGKPGSNYINGVDVCQDCLEERNLCPICSLPIERKIDQNNTTLQNLIKTCEKLEATILRFNIYSTDYECPIAVIEDKDGRISRVYYENGVWN